jgi:hypothetical protein
VRGSVLSLSFVDPNKRDRPKKPDGPDPRHAPQNSECLLFSAADPHSSCGKFHEFVASWKDGRILTCKYIRIAHIASHLSISTEGTMRTHSQPPTTPQTVDRRMLGVLKKKGAQSMEGLSTLMGIGWAQVFMSVDRLSRIGKVSLTPVRPCEYRIWIGGLLRR